MARTFTQKVRYMGLTVSNLEETPLQLSGYYGSYPPL